MTAHEEEVRAGAPEESRVSPVGHTGERVEGSAELRVIDAAESYLAACDALVSAEVDVVLHRVSLDTAISRKNALRSALKDRRILLAGAAPL